MQKSFCIFMLGIAFISSVIIGADNLSSSSSKERARLRAKQKAQQPDLAEAQDNSERRFIMVPEKSVFIDYYAVLKIKPEATLAEIKAAVYKLKRRWQPDRKPWKNPKLKEELERRIKRLPKETADPKYTVTIQQLEKIRAAEKVLTDEKLKAAYDKKYQERKDASKKKKNHYADFINPRSKHIDQLVQQLQRETDPKKIMFCYLQLVGYRAELNHYLIEHEKELSMPEQSRIRSEIVQVKIQQQMTAPDIYDFIENQNFDTQVDITKGNVVDYLNRAEKNIEAGDFNHAIANFVYSLQELIGVISFYKDSYAKSKKLIDRALNLLQSNINAKNAPQANKDIAQALHDELVTIANKLQTAWDTRDQNRGPRNPNSTPGGSGSRNYSQLPDESTPYVDYYKLLAIKQTATPEEIKKAFRKAALLNHPDKGGNTTEFQKLGTAYETLSDETKRKLYDFRWKRENAAQASKGSSKNPG